jgi:hypothetical protein
MLVGLTPITYCLSAVANLIPASYVNHLGRNLHGHSDMSHTRMYTCALELVPSSRVLFEKQMVAQFPTKLPVSYGTRRYITVFKAARQWNLTCERQYVIAVKPTNITLSWGSVGQSSRAYQHYTFMGLYRAVFTNMWFVQFTTFVKIYNFLELLVSMFCFLLAFV